MRLPAALLGLSACLCACGTMQLKPMKGRATEVDCLGGLQQKEEIFSGLEDSLRRAGDISFAMPYACREPLRMAMENVSVRDPERDSGGR